MPPTSTWPKNSGTVMTIANRFIARPVGAVQVAACRRPRRRHTIVLIVFAPTARACHPMTWRLARVKEMDARIYILAGQNLFEFADVPPETMQVFDLARK